MKLNFHLAILALVAVPTMVHAGDKDVLTVVEGGLHKGGVVKTCVIDNTYDFKKVDVLALIRAASKEKLGVVKTYVRANTPSVEIFAHRMEKYAVGPAATGLRQVSIKLAEDYGNRQEVSGPEAKELIKLAEDICGIK